MQTVSENWKNAHRQTLLNESYVEVSMDIGDPDALADASSQDNGAIYISDTSQIVSEVDKNIVPYCTLEQNIWLLDGNRKAIPESASGERGYIGDALSDEVCVFSDGVFAFGALPLRKSLDVWRKSAGSAESTALPRRACDGGSAVRSACGSAGLAPLA